MKVLILSGTSNLAISLVPHITSIADVITAGRTNCDLYVDLLAAPEEISFPENVDALIITAAAFAGETLQHVLNTEAINVLGTIKLCSAAARSGVRHVILISTALVTVGGSPRQYSAYSVSKRHSEEVAQLCCSKEDIGLTILRPSRIYGDSDSFRKHQPFLYMIADRAESNQNIEIYGTQDAKRNFIHVEDLCHIVTSVVRQKAFGVFQCVYPMDVSISQIVRSAHVAFSSDASIIFRRERPDMLDDDFLHEPNLYQTIGYSPQISIEDGFARIARHRRSQKF
jgi:nucleoside-diphosphate-sugar epimerase